MAAARCIKAKWLASVFSKRTSSFRKRVNQEWQASTTHRLALNWGLRANSSRSSPRGRTWGTNPAPSIAFCGSTPAYPASVHRFSTTPPRATRVMRDSSTAVSCDTSCRLAPVTTIDNGTPRSSTSRCRLDPFFSPICGVATDGLLGKGGLVHRTVDCLPLPGDAHHIIVFSQTFSPKREEEAGLFPLPKICMNGTGATEALFGQCLPLDSCAQNVDNGFKYLTRI